MKVSSISFGSKLVEWLVAEDLIRCYVNFAVGIFVGTTWKVMAMDEIQKNYEFQILKKKNKKCKTRRRDWYTIAKMKWLVKFTNAHKTILQ